MKVFPLTINVFILIGMSLYIGYGFIFQSGMAVITQSMMPFWGKFVWTDLFSTFILFATVIFTYERNWIIGLLMLVLMNLLGAAAIAAWLLWRGPDLYLRIRTRA